jgi:hypothetical protein
MNEFYTVITISFFDDIFAYCEPTNDAEYVRPAPKCPKCGMAIGSLIWSKPRKVILSKPKYGDFVCGNDFLVSERFKNAYENSDLKGIKEFTPVEVAKVRYLKKNSQFPPQYYTIELAYSFARIDVKKSIVKGQTTERYCSLCEPFKSTKDEIRGITIDDTDWGGEDIFHLHEMGGTVFATQKFVDFCTKNKFTNFMYVNTRDYTC